MAEGQSPERVALLKGWVAEVQSVAVRRLQGSVEEYPAPPAGLSPQECEAAGFDLYEGSNARYPCEITLRIAFSPDLQHQIVFLEEARRVGGVHLWLNGQPASVPVDRHGAPQSEILMRWLDRRFSKGALANVRDPARVLALWAWITEAGRIAVSDPHRYKQDYPAPPSGLTPEDCKATGFQFYHERSAHHTLEEGGKGAVRIDFSPDFQHQAVSIQGSQRWSGALLWVDSVAVPVPRDKRGDPRSDLGAEWLDNRFVCVEIGGLWDHPLLDPRAMDDLGNIRGLLIWDAQNQVQRLELPAADEAWTHPRLRVRGGSWCIYPDHEAIKKEMPGRVLPMPSDS